MKGDPHYSFNHQPSINNLNHILGAAAQVGLQGLRAGTTVLALRRNIARQLAPRQRLDGHEAQ